MLFVLSVVPLQAAERAALVIGNNAYQNATQLQTATNDAQAVWENLRDLGFAAGNKPVLNASLETTVEAVEAFKVRASGASAAIVYFAGHGIEHDGVNYLIPVDALLEKAVQLKTQAYSLNTLLTEVKSLRVPTRLVILDCCRNNPLPERSWTRGDSTLADIADEALGGATMVVFSAAPGTKAKDRLTVKDTHSPFATALLQQFAVPGQGLFNLFGEVEKSVFAATSESQKPKLRFSGDVSPFATFLLHPGGQQVTARINPGMTEAEVQRRVAEELAKRAPVPPATVSHPSGTMPNSGTVLPGPNPDPVSPSSLLDSGAAGKVIQLKLPGGVLMKFCYCPAGSFTMGSPASEKERGENEKQVQVKISKGFWMAQTHCTQAQWQALMRTTPAQQKAKGNSYGDVNGLGSDHPMYFVSATEADDYCVKLNSAVSLPTGWKASLPTEAQWEYACRAGTETAFSFGNVLNGKQANCDGNYPYGTTVKGPYLEKTSVVGSYPANAWGIYDMHGNVWQWCADGYATALPGGTDPFVSPTGVYRVFRGGSWSGNAASCRAASRSYIEPGDRYLSLGFRPALVPSK